jgi:hypothetical protein
MQPMSQLGQTRRFRDVRDMSGLPQTADISGPSRHFAFGPGTDIYEPSDCSTTLHSSGLSLTAGESASLSQLQHGADGGP